MSGPLVPIFVLHASIPFCYLHPPELDQFYFYAQLVIQNTLSTQSPGTDYSLMNDGQSKMSLFLIFCPIFSTIKFDHRLINIFRFATIAKGSIVDKFVIEIPKLNVALCWVARLQNATPFVCNTILPNDLQPEKKRKKSVGKKNVRGPRAK
jgi:hypothetical protein